MLSYLEYVFRRKTPIGKIGSFLHCSTLPFAFSNFLVVTVKEFLQWVAAMVIRKHMQKERFSNSSVLFDECGGRCSGFG